MLILRSSEALVIPAVVFAFMLAATVPARGEDAKPLPTSIPELVQLVRGTDKVARWKASMALGKIGAPAVPSLTEVLKDTNPQARIAAANALRDMKAQAAPAVRALAESLSAVMEEPMGQTVASIEVRRTAAGALGAIGPPTSASEGALPAVPALVDMLLGKHELVDPRPEAPGVSRVYELRGAAAWVLQILGPRAAEFPQTVPVLAAALKDPERMVRLNAANALGRFGPAAKNAVPPLIEALKHPDQFTRIYAALALGGIGRDAAPAVPALKAALATIRDDRLSQDRIRRVIQDFSKSRITSHASRRGQIANRKSKIENRPGFLLAVQPLQTQSRIFDQDALTQAFLDAKVANAFCFWPDHTWYNIPAPTADQMKRWGMAGLWYFFTEDIFNPKQQRDWGYATLDEYNVAVTERILEMGRVLGKDRCIWSVGHEHMDSLHGWGVKEDASREPPQFKSKREGYEYYRRWISTSAHNVHWNGDYGNNRPHKFFNGWNTGAKATWEFLADHKVDTSPVTVMSGGVCPALAHASFDILPQIGMYWWECQIEGTSLQIGSAYTRGAARQYGKKWLLDASPWSPVYGDPRHDEQGKWAGGVTDEMQLRTWTYGYLAGADVVFEEASGSSHFYKKPDGTLAPTSAGETAKEAARFCFELCPDRGEPYNPIALLLEHEHGFEPRPHTNFRGSGPWGYMPWGEGEYAIERFFQMAFPDHSVYPDRKKVDPNDKPAAEPLILHESTFGDCFDVLTDRCLEKALRRYPRIITLGGIVVGPELLAKLKKVVSSGAEWTVNAANLSDEVLADPVFGVGFGEWRDSSGAGDGMPFSLRQVRPGSAKVLRADADGRPLILENAVGKGKVLLITARHSLGGPTIGPGSRWLPVVTEFLKGWIAPVWPVSVATASGHPPQVLLNRLRDGWLVTIGNHWGQEWRGSVTLRLDRAKQVEVTDVWRQRKLQATVAADRAGFDATVAKYSLAVYRVRQKA